eukprot:4258641-Pyramimonas_sp.AAC.1
MRSSGELTFRANALSSPRSGSPFSGDCAAERSLASLVWGSPSPSPFTSAFLQGFPNQCL